MLLKCPFHSQGLPEEWAELSMARAWRVLLLWTVRKLLC